MDERVKFIAVYLRGELAIPRCFTLLSLRILDDLERLMQRPGSRSSPPALGVAGMGYAAGRAPSEP
jgi:hypothetical protein